MNCFLTPLSSLSPAEAEKAFISVERHLLATAGDDGTLRLYRLIDQEVTPNPSHELRDHHAPIVSVNFSPLTHKNYLLTVGYDKSLHLYHLEEPKGPILAFSYVEENKEVGFFTCATFVPTEKGRLLFLIGTSTGALLIFDSKGHFEPKVVTPLTGSIRAISANREGEVLIAVAGKGAVLFPDLSLTNFIELGDSGQAGHKVSHVAFAPDYFGSKTRLFFTAGDERLALWEFEPESAQVLLQHSFELGGTLAGAFWALSGLSLYVLHTRKGQSGGAIEAAHIARNLNAQAIEWSLEPVNMLS